MTPFSAKSPHTHTYWHAAKHVKLVHSFILYPPKPLEQLNAINFLHISRVETCFHLERARVAVFAWQNVREVGAENCGRCGRLPVSVANRKLCGIPGNTQNGIATANVNFPFSFYGKQMQVCIHEEPLTGATFRATLFCSLNDSKGKWK